MTTISEVRTAFEEVVRCLSYAQTSPWPEDAIHVVETWLDAQDAAEERWEPVEDIRWLGDLHSFNDIRVIDGMILGVWLSAPGVPPVTANIELPADLRLCRRVEVKP